MNETQLKNAVLKMIKKEFPAIVCFKIADKFTSGIPDLLICQKGVFIAIELKAPDGGIVSKIQMHTLNRIIDAGGESFIARNLAEVRYILKTMGGITCVKNKALV